MVAGVVVAAWHLMRMAMRGMKGAMISFGHHCAWTMLDRLNRRRCGKG
jgi:hypothetical protein